MPKVVALAGGVGGAKMAYGLSRVLDKDELTVIVNTGDDFNYGGLYICPDLDTVMYSLAELNNTKTGWGRENETWNVYQELEAKGEAWFKLGDKDIALHIMRTKLNKKGYTLTQITKKLSKKFGIEQMILPMTDSLVSTKIYTRDHEKLDFQDYFVTQKFLPKIERIAFEGIEKARLTAEIDKSLRDADYVIFCPSNPFVSIRPILEIQGLQNLLINKTIVAVSPIIKGKAVKGPAAKMFNELGYRSDCVGVAEYYGRLVSGMMIDSTDTDLIGEIERCGIIPLAADILMPDKESKIQLARQVIRFADQLIKGL